MHAAEGAVRRDDTLRAGLPSARERDALVLALMGCCCCPGAW